MIFIYHETMIRELDKRLIYECRCDERLKAKDLHACHTKILMMMIYFIMKGL
jgi:hypothetical protein